MYLIKVKKGEGVAQMHYGTHIVRLYYRTALWVFMKLGRDEVIIAMSMH